jgi:hypothetical protein
MLSEWFYDLGIITSPEIKLALLNPDLHLSPNAAISTCTQIHIVHQQSCNA